MKKVIIADDSFFQRKTLQDILKDLGHESEAVSSGEELLESLSESHDCIFLDLLMGGMSGIDVLKELKARGNETPVVVITADIQKARKEEVMSLGATAFMNKVVNKDELVSILNNIFN
ncbi:MULTISPECIES: response regulator [unclassified Ekhidna]|jgi:CheY-like chemotaxis protein|uniref:response regulator n=1 Tax=unclassified Ekhidna TaxID=2632188 RepID=UPI0032DFECAE